MRVLFLFLAISAFCSDDADQITKELQGLHGELKGAVQKIQEQTAGFDGQKISIIREKIVRLAKDEKFLQAAQELWASPNRNTLLVSQLIFAVVMFLFKAWRQARASNWLTRLFVGFLLGGFTWFGLIFLLPYFFFGDPFRVFVSTLWNL